MTKQDDDATRRDSRRTKRIVGSSVTGVLIVGGIFVGAQIATAAGAPNPTADTTPVYLSPTDTPSPDQVARTHQERVHNFPPAQPISPAAIWATEKQVTDTAKLFAQSPDGLGVELPPDVREALPTQAVLTEYASVVRAEFDGEADPDIALDRPVWVVVVHGTIRNDSAYAGEPVGETVHDVFTAIYDAPTGSLIAYGSGSDAFANGLATSSTLSLPGSTNE